MTDDGLENKLTMVRFKKTTTYELSKRTFIKFWLEFGPDVAAVRRANYDVRQVLSDMGTELGICDARDVVGQCVGQPVAD